MRCVGVIGSGQMGLGIAQVSATYGYDVFLVDISKDQLKKAKEKIIQSAKKLSEKGLLTAQQVENLSAIRYEESLQALKNADLIIEAATEDELIKNRIFKGISEVVSEKALIATNTSSLPITRLARSVSYPERFLGLHFMNPVPLMKLVEVIPGLATSDQTLKQGLDFIRSLQKEIVLSKDYPGFIINRILMPMINEAFFALWEGLATASDIDQGMKLGTNQPMGPLALADFIGLDTCLSIMRVLHIGFGDSKYRPCPLLIQYVEAGFLGRKTKRGVFTYEHI